MALIDNDVATIAINTAVSSQINLGDKTLCGFHMPAAWDAAAMSFRVSPDGGTTWSEFYDVKAASATVTVAAGQYIALDPNAWRGVNCVQFRSGTVGAPVNQTGGARTITAVSKRAF